MGPVGRAISDLEAAVQTANRDKHCLLYGNRSLTCFMLDTSGVILWLNASGAESLGYTEDELLGKSVRAFIHPGDRDGFWRHFQSCVGDPSYTGRLEVRRLCADGTVRWLRQALRRVDSGPRGQDFVVLVGEDVTEHKEAEKRLLDYQERLQAVSSSLSLAEERERRRIATGLHDELGQLLAMAKIRLAELNPSSPSGANAKTAAELRELLDRAIDKTRSLTFELSSPVLYELGLVPALCELAEGLSRANRDLHCRVTNDTHAKPLADEVKIVLFQAARELLFNVVKHARARTVNLHISRRGDRIELLVHDDGRGFELDASGAPVHAESGFGLFSIEARLRSIAGQMEIDSAPGRGTRVTVSAPLIGTGSEPERE